jgi:hypothetical protein
VSGSQLKFLEGTCPMSQIEPDAPCRYAVDRVPPHTSSKLRHEAGCATMHCRMSHSRGPCLPTREGCYASRGSRPRLPTREGSRATMCPMTMDLISLLRRAPGTPCVPQLQTPPPCTGGLRGYHVSHYPWETNKEVFGYNGQATRLTCYRGVLTQTEAPARCPG